MATQFVDFLEIENYDFVFNPLLIDVANKLKANESISRVQVSEPNQVIEVSFYLAWNIRISIEKLEVKFHSSGGV